MKCTVITRDVFFFFLVYSQPFQSKFFEVSVSTRVKVMVLVHIFVTLTLRSATALNDIIEHLFICNYVTTTTKIIYYKTTISSQKLTLLLHNK